MAASENSGKKLGYTYGSINPDQIRIIEVKSIAPEIVIDLVDYTDESLPEYTALSYAWGEQRNSERIICNGESFELTTHLKEGLLSIWTIYGLCKLWVDAICIDQTSDSQKATQVSKMHEIYRRAKEVIVWLGLAEDGSDIAISAINSITLTTSDKPLGEQLFRRRFDSPRLFEIADFKPIAALSSRSWFRRLWIAQEYLLAQSVKFICGRSILDGKWFVDVLMKLSIHSFGPEESLDFQNEIDLFVGYSALRELQKIKEKREDSKGPVLFDFVQLNRDRFGKEPVDKIFASFGLASGSDSIYKENIPINYSEDTRKHYWKLYSQFGKIALVHEPGLRLLSIVSSKERPEELPSWCPNFNSASLTDELDSTGVYSAGWPWKKHGGFDETKQYSSSQCRGHPHFLGKLESHVTTSLNSDLISIWGARLGRITAVGLRCEWDIDIDMKSLSSLQDLSKGFLRWLFRNEKLCQGYFEDEKKANFVNEEVMVGKTSDIRRLSKLTPEEERRVWGVSPADVHEMIEPPSELQQLDASEENTTCSTEEQNSPPNPDSSSNLVQQDPEYSEKPQVGSDKDDSRDNHNGRSVSCAFVIAIFFSVLEMKQEDWEKRDDEFMEQFEMAYTWVMFLYQTWHHRVLVITENGYFGYASEDVNVDDIVCMFYGGPSLYVLRQHSEHHRFVSDAFVFNCVNGEMFEMLDAGDIREELFNIS